MDYRIRLASVSDIPELRALIELSVRQLQAGDYTPAQLDESLQTVYGVDTQLISDSTYFVVEAQAGEEKSTIVGCGGWSKRKTLYGGDQWSGRQDSLLDPRIDAAKIRAFFVHPAWVRKGIGTLILQACEEAAGNAGFHQLEMGATLTGVPFYSRHGYEAIENQDVPMRNGLTLPIVHMTKRI